MAGPADDRALGHRGSGCGEGTGYGKGSRLRRRLSLPKEPDRRFANLPLSRIDKLSLGTRLREIGRLDGASNLTRRQTDGYVRSPRRLSAEALGTGILVATVVGSGIMAETLTRDAALALLCNTLPTGAILVVLISFLGPISGAHFNPAVTLVFTGKRELPPARGRALCRSRRSPAASSARWPRI